MLKKIFWSFFLLLVVGLSLFILSQFGKKPPLSKGIKKGDQKEATITRGVHQERESSGDEGDHRSDFSNLKVEQIGNIDEYKKDEIEAEKSEKNDKWGVKISPTDDFIENYKNNENDLSKTLKQIDLEKPPVQGEVRINF